MSSSSSTSSRSSSRSNNNDNNNHDPTNRTRNLVIGIVVVGILLLIVLAANHAGGAAGGDIVFVDDSGATTTTNDQQLSQQQTSDEGIVFVEPNNNDPAPETSTTTTNPIGETTPDPTAAPAATKEPKVVVVEETTAAAAPKKKTPNSNSRIPLLEADKEAGPISTEKRDNLIDTWGGWHFWDGDEETRPKDDDYITKYSHLDIPGDDFPQDSWQTDAVYVNHYLDAADKLITRAMEAIFTEYGHGKPLPPEGLANRMAMFHWDKDTDMSNNDNDNNADAESNDRHQATNGGGGGWTTKRSFDGLVRRLLHAMLTRDTFTVVVAGTTGTSSSQSQRRNHFRQSYAMQFHRIMEPIFARLNVKLITHNMKMTNDGTMLGGGALFGGGIGASDIYGQDIDLFLWDNDDDNISPEYTDLVLRQVLMSSKRVPLLWGGPFALLKLYHEEADADVGDFGTGYAGIPETTNDDAQAETLPWAVRYMKCSSDGPDLCQNEKHRYNSVCWIDRTDGIKPAQDQLLEYQHPEQQQEQEQGEKKKEHRPDDGWRSQQLQGRVLAFSILEGLEVAVNTWMEGTMTGQPLDDDYWHVTDYYENIRSKIRNMDPKLGPCSKIATATTADEQQQQLLLPSRMCHTPMNGRTQYTPRADGSSLNSIVKAAPSGKMPTNDQKALYEGPDMHNPVYDVPEGHIDVLSIVMGRRRLLSSERELQHTDSTLSIPIMDNTNLAQPQQQQQKSHSLLRRQLLLADEEIVPGEGWDIALEPQGHCDGTYDSVCAHGANEECFLLGHHEQRGAIVGCEWSGWLVMTLTALKEGIIVIKLQTWHGESENPTTKELQSTNAKRRLGFQESDAKELHSDTDHHSMGELTFHPEIEKISQNATVMGRRRIETKNTDAPELPDTFAFDYAINGTITTLNKAEFLAKNPQRGLETMTLLDDPEFTKEAKDVEVAIRLRGVERKVFFGVSHIYWA